jgi:hypothetical protein
MNKALKRTANNPTMLKAMIAILLLAFLWEPIKPVRNVTADVLYTAGDLIRR